MRDDLDAYFYRARDLCVAADIITECEVHDGEYLDHLISTDPEEIVRLILEDSPNSISEFKSREHMVETISEVLRSASIDCELCKETDEG